jgi:hypothetical protein
VLGRQTYTDKEVNLCVFFHPFKIKRIKAWLSSCFFNSGITTQICLTALRIVKRSHSCHVWAPLWSSGQSGQIRRSGFDSRRYQIFWEVVGLERDPLSLVSTIEELLERKGSGFGLENREYDRRDPSRWPRGTPYHQKLALTSPTSVCLSVGIVRSRTEATDFFFFQNEKSRPITAQLLELFFS